MSRCCKLGPSLAGARKGLGVFTREHCAHVDILVAWIAQVQHHLVHVATRPCAVVTTTATISTAAVIERQCTTTIARTAGAGRRQPSSGCLRRISPISRVCSRQFFCV